MASGIPCSVLAIEHGPPIVVTIQAGLVTVGPREDLSRLTIDAACVLAENIATCIADAIDLMRAATERSGADHD